MTSNPEKYRHTQIGYLMLFALFAVSLLFWSILVKENFNVSPAVYVIMAIVLSLLISFGSLTVTIDQSTLKVVFGYGIYKKDFPLKDIASVKTARHHWYYGWGIRIWFWPRMIIYNVSGFNTVEIILKNGKRYRIGTNEPEKLERAIHLSKT